jgi:hypothetical protein
MVGRRREEYRQPEERTLADLLVGNRVILQHMVGPEPDPDEPDKEIRGPLEAVTGAYWLHAISHQGIEISLALSGEAADIFLVPWSSILMLDGAPRGELEEEAKGTFAIDRKELLDRLSEPQEEDRNLDLDARRYLSFNPKDEEVRAALEELPSERRFPFV